MSKQNRPKGGPSPDRLDALGEEFLALEKDAYILGEELAKMGEAYGSTLDSLLPKLSRAHSILSQRGVAYHQMRDRLLPSWSQWIREFMVKTPLGKSLRTIRRQIKDFNAGRAEMSVTRKTGDARKLEIQRVLSMALVSLDLAEALLKEQDYEMALESFQATSVNRDTIVRLLKKYGVREVPAALSRKIDQFAEPFEPRTEGSAVWNNADSALYRPGNWSKLASDVAATYGAAMKATFNVDPGLMRSSFHRFISQLVNGCLPIDRDRGELHVDISWIEKVQEPLRKG